MATVRETLQAEIDQAKTVVATKEASLAKLESEAAVFLGHEMDVVKGWFETLKQHFEG